MRKITQIATILLIAFAVTAASAQPERTMGPREQKGFNIDRLTKALELTEAQAAQVQQMHYENQKSEIDLRSSLEKNRLEIHNMVASNNIVDSELLNMTAQNSDIMSEIKINKTKLWLEVYNILDATQQIKWAKSFQRMGAEGRDRDGRMKQQRIREHNPDIQDRDR